MWRRDVVRWITAGGGVEEWARVRDDQLARTEEGAGGERAKWDESARRRVWWEWAGGGHQSVGLARLWLRAPGSEPPGEKTMEEQKEEIQDALELASVNLTACLWRIAANNDLPPFRKGRTWGWDSERRLAARQEEEATATQGSTGTAQEQWAAVAAAAAGKAEGGGGRRPLR